MKNVPVSIVILLRRPSATQFEMWMQRRQAPGTLNNLWEFPGGKIEKNEKAIDAARREVFEEMGLDLSNIPLIDFKIYQYQFEDRCISLNVYLAQLENVKSVGHIGEWFQIKYTVQSQNFKGKIPPANHQIIDELCCYLKKKFKSGEWDFSGENNGDG